MSTPSVSEDTTTPESSESGTTSTPPLHLPVSGDPKFVVIGPQSSTELKSEIRKRCNDVLVSIEHQRQMLLALLAVEVAGGLACFTMASILASASALFGGFFLGLGAIFFIQFGTSLRDRESLANYRAMMLTIREELTS